MSAYTTRQELPGSLPAAASSALRLGALASDERFDVTVRVRPRATPPDLAATDAALAPKPAQQQQLSREQYDAAFGADPADLAKVADFARHFGLVVLDSSSARRSVFLSGTAEQFAAAFGTQIEQVEHAGGVGRSVAAPLSVPTEVGDIVEGVFGLSDAPVARPHLQQLPEAQAAAAGASFTPPQLARLYNFPTGVDGSGQCIAIIELGGGFRTADIGNFFKGLHLPVPKVKSISVDGGKNHPTTANSADGEVMLDIEVAAGVAPKALIAVYFAPNTDKGFLDAITAAIHDKVNKPSVISISWGAAEKFWTPQALRSYDAAFQSAATLGVTVCCAAGDAGSGDENPDQGQPDGLAHVDFPAASPHVLACGGTRLSANGGGIASETVWNDDPLRSASGGGVSDFFDLPAYQNGAGVPASANPGGRVGRGVPDVAGDADPNTGYQVLVDGRRLVFGGTSAVAPLWAGLVALMNQKLGHHVGFLNPLLYGAAVGSGATHDITVGDIGAYRAGAGWDACTGWGSPNGAKLLQVLGS